MKNAFSFLLVLCLIILNSCVPNYNYRVEPPTDWTMYDTVMQGLKVRILKAPKSLAADNPIVNIIIKSMGNSDIDNFTIDNMDYLKSNMGSVVLLEKGNIDISTINARWFTYTKEHNGIIREMINYIIPVKGSAYMITCGTNKGSMSKYRLTFDKIAQSFKE